MEKAPLLQASINNGSNLDEEESFGGEEELTENTKNELGTINGVYVPCLLNILGTVLFMRIGYSVGYAGWIGTILIFVFSELITILTALSFSSIVTNGKMAGGGAYYMISRSMGPSFGGATGIIFYTTYVANCAFNATAFVEDIIQTFYPDSPHAVTLYFYHGTLFVLLLVALGGAGAFARVNTLLFITLFTSIIVSLGSLMFTSHSYHVESLPANGTGSCNSVDDELHFAHNVTYYPPRSERLVENFYPSWDSNNDLVVVLALIFTSTCGVMEGANLSGDLKDPAKSLPKGTLMAKATSFTTYILFTTMLALCFDRRSLKCEYLILQKTAVSPYFVVVGIAMATLSTSLGALFGAARILQAIARDHILPLGFFAFGAKKGDEPRYAVVLTWLFANGFGYLGGTSVRGLATILTDFFLTAYALVNLSQALLSLTAAPNYRPVFKFASWWSSSLGFILSIALMWYLGPIYAGVTTLLWLVLFSYIKLTANTEKDWGDISQALLYRVVVARLKELVQRKDSAKFWRSSVLLLISDADVPLLTFCKYLTVDGLYLIGVTNIEKEEEDKLASASKRRPTLMQSMLPFHRSAMAVTKAAWLWLVEHARLDAFITVANGYNLEHTLRTLISCAGMGGLVPNTVVLPFPEAGAQQAPDYVSRIDNQVRNIYDTSSVKFRERTKALPTKARQAERERIESLQRKPCKQPTKCLVCSCQSSYNSSLGLHNKPFIKLLGECLDAEKNVLLVRNSKGLAPLFHGLQERHKLMPTNIDVWIFGEWDWETLEENITLLLQHAHIMQKALGRVTKLRILQLVRYFFSTEQNTLQEQLKDLVLAARLPMPEILVFCAPEANKDQSHDSIQHYTHLNEVVAANSSNTTLAFMALPTLPNILTEDATDHYLKCLDTLTAGLPPVVLAAKGEPTPILSTHI
eukprot:m.127964 g.127964  ORF g.127964 m.127964 type:complete len:923 (-) comp14555_c0_seq2:1027-3795(-)